MGELLGVAIDTGQRTRLKGVGRHLAEQANRLAEYDAVYSLYSAAAHGDAWTATLPGVAGRDLLHVMAYWARLLILVADAKKMVLTGEAYETLAQLAKGPVG